MIGSTYEPLEVTSADACKKIIRRWTVIDWCTWEANGSYVDDENDTSYDQFQAVDDEWLDAYDPTQQGKWYATYYDTEVRNYDEAGNLGGYVTPLVCGSCEKQQAGVLSTDVDAVYFRYTRVDRDGYYTFDQVIKIIDETPPVIDVVAEVTLSITDGAQAKGDDFDDCYASDVIPASVSDMCNDIDISGEGATWWITRYALEDDGSRGDVLATKSDFGQSTTMGTGPGTQGDHVLIVWQATDGCGNTAEAETVIWFVDDKQPTPVCIQDLSTAIMPSSGTVEIWAADYDNGSFDNCSEVEFYFLLDDDGNPTDDLGTGTLTANLLVTCAMLEEFGQGETLVLGLYVVDAQGNIDFCNITLNVNGAAEVCDFAGVASVSGEIANPRGNMVEKAEVALNVGAKDLTSVDGKFAFNLNTNPSSYEIKASKNDDYINGVSTLDLVLIQKHALGVALLDSPYKVVAGDINNDEQITAFDLVELRKLILGIYAELPNNDSWRFVDAQQTFDDALLPWPLQEVISVNNPTSNMENQNFVGVKIGDVSGNAIANSALALNRSVSNRLVLSVENTTMAKGELIEVSVSSSNFSDIAAYQFTMELNGLEFVGSTSGAIEVDAANFGLIDANTVTTAWFSTEAVTSEGANDLFTMTFRATTDGALSSALAISSRVTRAAAYTSTQEELDVAIEYNTIGEAGFALLQNTPNPFDQLTTIGFELPDAGTATLTVFDVTGKTLSVINASYGAGYNEIILSKSELGLSGVLYYQLESGDFTATRKMILIK